MKRSAFMKSFGMSAMALPIFSMYAHNNNKEEPQLDKVLVQEFVGKSHSDIVKVKELLEEYPTLLNSAHDWKFGDFETGLGAASHVGYVELVEFFLQQGAQANIFTFALLGKLDIIRGMLTYRPALLNAKGPHGFTLLHHAERGGEVAIEVKKYLKSLGATKTKITLY